jgi:hypothetical protein
MEREEKENNNSVFAASTETSIQPSNSRPSLDSQPPRTNRSAPFLTAFSERAEVQFASQALLHFRWCRRSESRLVKLSEGEAEGVFFERQRREKERWS